MDVPHQIQLDTRIRRAPRGVLSFITNESLELSPYSESVNSSCVSTTRRITKRARRWNSDNEVMLSGDTCDGNTSDEVTSSQEVPGDACRVAPTLPIAASSQSSMYDHNNSEFTLIFFGAPYCRHTLQFIPKLAQFVRCQNEQRLNSIESLPKMVVQCICIPDCINVTDVRQMLRGTGFFYFPQCNLNSSFQSIKALIPIQWIPAVVVIENQNGKIITDWGRTAIEFNEESCVEAWRNGKSGASYLWRLLTAL